MISRQARLRIILALVATPFILPVFILLFVVSSNYFSFGTAELSRLFMKNLGRVWLSPVISYVLIVALLLPYCLWLRRRQKLRLGFFLLGAYLAGGLAQSLSIVVFLPSWTTSNLHFFTLLTIFITSMLTGGTYNFFQAFLFWHLAGLQDLDKAVPVEC